MKLIYDKVKGMLYGALIGDILGVPYEFSNKTYINNNFVRDYTYGGIHNQPKYSWSDDTSMSLALMSSLIKNDLIYIKKDVINEYIEWYKNGKYTFNGEVFDIGIQTRIALSSYYNNIPLEKNEEALGNGALMRSHVLSLFFNGIVYLDTSITHYSNKACLYSISYCDLLKRFLNNDNNEMIEFKDINLLNFNLNKEIDFNPKGYVRDTLHIALYELNKNNNFEDSLFEVIKYGYDTDTNATITGALAGARYGFEAIPKYLIEPLLNTEATKIIDKYLNKLKEREIIQ